MPGRTRDLSPPAPGVPRGGGGPAVHLTVVNRVTCDSVANDLSDGLACSRAATKPTGSVRYDDDQIRPAFEDLRAILRTLPV